MTLERFGDYGGAVWELDGKRLPKGVTLQFLLGMKRDEMLRVLEALPAEIDDSEFGLNVSPVEEMHEVWAAGVTYLRSRVEREAESSASDVYARVYEAERPELFFKSVGWRVVGNEDAIFTRGDSTWNVPEPELTLVINAFGEIVGYTVGNDVSSRSIEGENPLYLPQAKTYHGSCAIGPVIQLATEDEMSELTIEMFIERDGEEVFSGETSVKQMKRTLSELVSFLFRQMAFPYGVFLMTGTGIVPTQEFTLEPGDQVTITIGDLVLENPVAGSPVFGEYAD